MIEKMGKQPQPCMGMTLTLSCDICGGPHGTLECTSSSPTTLIGKEAKSPTVNLKEMQAMLPISHHKIHNVVAIFQGMKVRVSFKTV